MNPATNPPGSVPFPRVPTVIFAHWREELNKAGLTEKARSGYSVAIGGYLEYSQRKGAQHPSFFTS